ncbi:MAG: phosphoadenylyl-sulfate reductase [Akkermansiaceae bacterium]|nr:phosphoadenylyl-sulfate reductase [Akkermansiaceae bacterium]NNM28677.1 phosphoadenylyl-sulfate reductase [Akkermansiaceae bacterium]
MTEGELSGLAETFQDLDAGERLRLLSERFAGRIVATSSFGLQSAVMLKLLKDHAPGIPVVFIDTGYLFPETYRYAQDLQERLGLEIEVYSPAVTPARQEALHGRLWEQGSEGMDQYARINKIEPMNRALLEHGANVWISGVRRSQSSTRAAKGFFEQQAKTLKVYPIVDWTDREVADYMAEHRLPPHPLAKLGYVTMGDWHSTKRAGEGDSAEETRFNGEKYECGLHLDSGVQDFQI